MVLIIHCWDSASTLAPGPSVVGIPFTTAPVLEHPLLWMVLGSHHTFVHPIVTEHSYMTGIAFSARYERFRRVVQGSDSSTKGHVTLKIGHKDSSEVRSYLMGTVVLKRLLMLECGRKWSHLEKSKSG